jgi:hypothetical protein
MNGSKPASLAIESGLRRLTPRIKPHGTALYKRRVAPRMRGLARTGPAAAALIVYIGNSEQKWRPGEDLNL